MKQLKKGELRKRIDDAYIFGNKHFVTVDEFVFNGNKYLIGRFKVYKGGLVELVSSDSINAKDTRNRLELNYDSFKNNVRIDYADKAVMIYSEKIEMKTYQNTSTKTTRSTSGQFVYEEDLSTNPIIGQVIYAESAIAPIVKICKTDKFVLDDILSIPIINVAEYWISQISNLLYNSFKELLKVCTEEIKCSEVIYPVMTVEDRTNAIFSSSSLPREKVVYDDNGIVIKYSNPLNCIKMSNIITPNGFEKKIFFRDYLMVLDSSYIDNNNNIIEIHYDFINGVEKWIDNGEEKEAIFDYENDLADYKLPKIKMEKLQSYPGTTNSIVVLTEDDNTMITALVDFEKTFVRIVDLHLFSDEKYHGGDSPSTILHTSFKGGGMFKQDNYYRFDLGSKSGINASGISFNFNVDLKNTKMNFKEYNDVDIHFKTDDNGNIIFFESKLLDDGDLIYVRDMFGIPELRYRKIDGKYIEEK